MKKIKYLILSFIFVFICTGCVKYTANMDIKKDKSMNFTIIYAFDKSTFGDKDFFPEEARKQIREQGFIVRDYNKDNMRGIKLEREYKNIDDYSSKGNVTYNLSKIADKDSKDKKIFTIKKGLFKNTYKAKFEFDSNDSNANTTNYRKSNNVISNDMNNVITSDNSNISDQEIGKAASDMDLSFNVSLPNAVKKNNATETSNKGKKLKWNLEANGKQTIEFEFEIYNMPIIYGAIVLGILIIYFGLQSLSRNSNRAKY